MSELVAEKILKVFWEQGWKFEPEEDDPDSYELTVSFAEREIDLYLTMRTLQKGNIGVMSILDEEIEEEKIPFAIRSFNIINRNLNLGNFEVNDETGEIVLKTGVVVYSTEFQSGMVDGLIYPILAALKTWYPFIEALCANKFKEFEDAIQAMKQIEPDLNLN